MLLEHNIPVYDQLESILSTDNKAIVVIGTCGGKTSTALEYLDRHNCRGLVITPSNTIKEDWSKYTNVDVDTYMGFANKYSSIDYSQYGAIICDEIHHGTAEVWGRGIRYVLENNLCKVIGLTATPERTDGVDVADELFEGNICQGINVKTGILSGIFYPFSYVGAYYDPSSVAKKYRDKASELLIGKLDVALNNTPTVKDILHQNIGLFPDVKRKGIIYVSDIESIPEAIAIIEEAFPGMECRVIHSKMDEDTLKANKNWFRTTDEGYIVAINMISEGAHYDGVNTIIMLRRTCSDLLFTQQIGRAITPVAKGIDPHTIVFDLVNNSKTITEFRKAIKEIEEQFGASGVVRALADAEGDEPSKSQQIIVKDYTCDIVDVINKIKEENDNSYEEWEDEIIRRYYVSEGVRGVSKRIREERDRRRVIR